MQQPDTTDAPIVPYVAETETAPTRTPSITTASDGGEAGGNDRRT